MNSSLVNGYASAADKMERDPYGPDGVGRAQVVNGRGFQAWRRFNRGGKTIWVENMDGQMYELTPNQYAVFTICRSNYSVPVTMRALAEHLKLSPSTISRAMVKLASFGLIAYLTGRGRYAVTFVIERAKNDGMDRFRRAAKAKVFSWRLAAEARISRLWANVAPYSLERRRGIDSLYWAVVTSTSTKDATLKAWTPDELREAGII